MSEACRSLFGIGIEVEPALPPDVILCVGRDAKGRRTIVGVIRDVAPEPPTEERRHD